VSVAELDILVVDFGVFDEFLDVLAEIAIHARIFLATAAFRLLLFAFQRGDRGIVFIGDSDFEFGRKLFQRFRESDIMGDHSEAAWQFGFSWNGSDSFRVESDFVLIFARVDAALLEKFF